MVAFVCLKVLHNEGINAKVKTKDENKALKKNQNWRSMDLHIGTNTDFLKSISRNVNKLSFKEEGLIAQLNLIS